MDSLMESLARQLDAGTLAQIGRTLGTDEAPTQRAIAGALPVLFGALAKNSSDRGGLASLAAAVDRDHDGSVLDDLSGFLGAGGNAAAGAGILGHVLGRRQPQVETAIGRTSGLDSAQIRQLLVLLAPLVMGALGRARRERRLDDAGLAGLLEGEHRRAASVNPQLGAIGELLDRDGDGDVFDDVAKAGTGLLGRLLGGR